MKAGTRINRNEERGTRINLKAFSNLDPRTSNLPLSSLLEPAFLLVPDSNKGEQQ